MKLNRDAFLKNDYDGGILYQYNCNDTDFFLYVLGKGKNKTISVFKGNVDIREDEFTTSDSLEAWGRFEEMLVVCEPQQGSSGGFARNQQQNPNILPLLAIKRNDSGSFDVALFAVVGDEQITIMSFEVTSDALTYPYPTKVFSVDWSSQEIPAVVKCEVLMKRYSDVEYQDDADRQVFVFVPKSIIEQGGEQGGGTSDEPNDQQQPQIGDEPTDQEPPQDGGDPSDQEPPDDGGQPSDQEPPDDEPSDQEPLDDTNDDGTLPQPTNERVPDDADPIAARPPMDFGETITTLSRLTELPPSDVINVFRSVKNGETFLLLEDFDNIKRELNLPPSTTPLQLSQQIINSK